MGAVGLEGGAEDGSGDDGDRELGVVVAVVVGRVWWRGERRQRR